MAVLRRADLDAACDARRRQWPRRSSSSRAVEARAAPWASKARKQDAAGDPRDPENGRHGHSDAHQSSSSRDGWQRDREGQRPQESGCPRERLSSSQIRPCDEIGVRWPRHRNSVGRSAHGPIVARYATRAFASAVLPRRCTPAAEATSPGRCTPPSRKCDRLCIACRTGIPRRSWGRWLRLRRRCS